MSSALAALAASQQSYGAEPAGAVDFDGTNDYLSRSSDLTGNADGKTFTFSAWVWPDNGQGPIYCSANATSGSLQPVIIGVGNAATGTYNLTILYRDYNSGITKLQAYSAALSVPRDTAMHVLISVDVSDTAKRWVYINDVQTTMSWDNYVNENIPFSHTYHYVGYENHWPSVTDRFKGRLAHVYLDYTYRDLSNVTNRRLFITADRKPAQGQAALNPILYLPMTDPTQPGKNSGTGGDFTLTGTIARSGRGPNQYNVPYSDLDGGNDYLSRASALTGIVDGKQVTCAFTASIDSFATSGIVLHMYAATDYFRVYLYSSGMQVNAYNPTTPPINFTVSGFTPVIGRNYHVVFSFDLTDTGKRYLFINGVSYTMSFSAYNNASIAFTTFSTVRVGLDSGGTNYYNGKLGALWFNASYIDLSQSSNLAKFVTGTGIDAKPVDLGANGELPTGTSPLIYLPMYGNNAGKNYGTGGDFTVNSGPYTGARGPNEFWGNWATFSSGNYLSRAAVPAGIADGKVGSVSFWIKRGATTSRAEAFWSNGQKVYLAINYNANGELYFLAKNASSTTILQFNTAGGALSASATSHVLFCFDLTSSALRQLYINGTSVTPTWGTYTNDTIDWTETNYQFNPTGGSWPFSDSLAEFYLATSYIDFSQEANRLLFRDAFGNPTNLPAAIQAGTVPNPAIYMRFDPASFGTNSGTGGNFTVNGTITDGGQL